MEGLIWTTAGALGLGSIIGIGILSFAVPQNSQPYDYLLRIGVALLSISIVWVWKIMTSRWHSIQRVMYYRTREIEMELNIYKDRYVNYLDKAVLSGKIPDNPQVKEMINSITSLKAKHKASGVRRGVQYLGWIILLAWLIFFILQLAALLNWF